MDQIIGIKSVQNYPNVVKNIMEVYWYLRCENVGGMCMLEWLA